MEIHKTLAWIFYLCEEPSTSYLYQQPVRQGCAPFKVHCPHDVSSEQPEQIRIQTQIQIQTHAQIHKIKKDKLESFINWWFASITVLTHLDYYFTHQVQLYTLTIRSWFIATCYRACLHGIETNIFLIKTSWDVGTLRHMIIIAFLSMGAVCSGVWIHKELLTGLIKHFTATFVAVFLLLEGLCHWVAPWWDDWTLWSWSQCC